MSNLPAAGVLGDLTSGHTNAEFGVEIEDLRDWLIETVLGASARYALTIATGSITPPDGATGGGGVFTVDTEAAAAADDLTNIVQTNTHDGQIIILQAVNAARVVTLKHAAGGTGQLQLWDSTDFVFASLNAWVAFQRRSTTWVEIMRFVPPEDLTALSAGPLEAADLLRIWDDSAGTEKRISAKGSATLAGLLELATNAEWLAGTDTERAITAANLASDKTLAAKGHYVFAGGLVLNWGSITFSAATGPATDTFSKAFSTAFVPVLSTNMNLTARITTFNTTTIGVTLSGSGTGTVYYAALGIA